MFKRLVTVFGLVVFLFAFVACGGDDELEEQAPPPAEGIVAMPPPTPPPAQDEPYVPEPEPELPVRGRPETDREGRAITLPDEINTLVVIGASTVEILMGLGFGDRIIVADIFSADALPFGVPAVLDMLSLETEFIINLMPDVVFISDMARAGGEDDPLAPVSAAGITVIYMPISASIAAIMEDIRFVAEVMEASEAGEAIISTMQREIDEVSQIAATITETRRVYFEVYPAPWMTSFGTGTFLNEMMEIVGAENIFAEQVGWVPVSDETILEANPDVILTSSDFLDDPIGEIMGRPGFDVITAVQNGDVFVIDANSSNRPSQNITRALREIAEVVFPEYFR